MGADKKIHKQEGEGYIELYHLKRSAMNPYYGAQTIRDPSKFICKPDGKNPNISTTEAVKPLDHIITSTHNFNIADKASVLNELVGSCPFDPASSMKRITDLL